MFWAPAYVAMAYKAAISASIWSSSWSSCKSCYSSSASSLALKLAFIYSILAWIKGSTPASYVEIPTKDKGAALTPL